MAELEKRVQSRGDEVMREFKNEFQTIIDKNISSLESLTNESYRKTLQMLLDLEKRLDTRQSSMLSELRNDFAKVVS